MPLLIHPNHRGRPQRVGVPGEPTGSILNGQSYQPPDGGVEQGLEQDADADPVDRSAFRDLVPALSHARARGEVRHPVHAHQSSAHGVAVPHVPYDELDVR